jgi:hypothetical protein
MRNRTVVAGDLPTLPGVDRPYNNAPGFFLYLFTMASALM